ncbi:MAG: hypothetical protein HUU01_19465 [Saprospiraceae bacterium]|nr:hypothetical protein [Saprospiraceae bacterium]
MLIGLLLLRRVCDCFFQCEPDGGWRQCPAFRLVLCASTDDDLPGGRLIEQKLNTVLLLFSDKTTYICPQHQVTAISLRPALSGNYPACAVKIQQSHNILWHNRANTPLRIPI